MQSIVKKLNIAIILTSIVFGVSHAQIISQYIETNSGIIPKGIEIWNNTAGLLDFSTNNLVIEKGTNGATPSTDYTLSTGTLAAGAVLVIGTSDLQTITESNGATFYLKPFTFNGDDALVVKYGGTITDVFGDPGTGDPGTGWAVNGVQTYNQNIALKADITTGDTDGWTDPSIRFDIVSTNPVGDMSGFGIAPSTISSGPDDPTSLLLTSISASQIDLSWTQNTNTDNVMIVYNTNGVFTDPVDGTSYSVSLSALGGTVIYNQSGTSFSHTSLAGGTQYYYKVWSVDGSDNYSTGITGNATTVKAEPSNHPSTFTATSDHNSIALTWTDNDGAIVADGFLIKASSISLEDISPAVDGTAIADDSDLSDGSAAINIAHGTETCDFTGLDSETIYYFTIWAYSNSGSNIDYKTDQPLISQSKATTAVPSYILNLDFESAGGYATNIAEFTDNGTDYFKRTDGSDIGSESFSNIQGSYYFAAQDIDGEGATLPLTLTIDDIDISGISDLNFSIMIAEDDAADAAEDWDAADYVHIDYDIDNSGTFSNLLHIESSGETNFEPKVDTNFDGEGDGTSLTSTFTEFSAAMSGSGSLVDIKITFFLNSGDEDIALDNIRLTGTGSVLSVDPEPSAHITGLAGTSTYKSITLSWSDNDGATPADKFLLCASTVSLSAISDPSDATEQSNDTDLSDGSGAVNINSGVQNYIWTGLNETTTYYFKIFPYTNSGVDIDYKTDGTIPALSLATGEMPKIVITEIMIDPDSTSDLNGEWIELYNAGAETVNIDGWILSDNGTDQHTISNGGTLNIVSGDYIVLGIDSSRVSNGDYPCDYKYSNFSLANSADEIIIKEGVTLIDSVAYDEAASWIIPVGASIAFVGTFDEDNNLYSNWKTSTLRLDNFTGMTGDKGSPGTSSTINCILNIKLFLEGSLGQ